MSTRKEALFVKANDISLRISKMEQVLTALKQRHPLARFNQVKHRWECPKCQKHARDASKLTAQVCRK